MSVETFLESNTALFLVCILLVLAAIGGWKQRHSGRVYSSGLDLSKMPEGFGYKQRIEWVRGHNLNGNNTKRKMSITKADLILRDWEKSTQTHDSIKVSS